MRILKETYDRRDDPEGLELNVHKVVDELCEYIALLESKAEARGRTIRDHQRLLRKIKLVAKRYGARKGEATLDALERLLFDAKAGQTRDLDE